MVISSADDFVEMDEYFEAVYRMGYLDPDSASKEVLNVICQGFELEMTFEEAFTIVRGHYDKWFEQKFA